MPLHLPHFGADKHRGNDHEGPSRRLSSSSAEGRPKPPSVTSSSSSRPHSILRQPDSLPSRSDSASPLDSRMASLSFNREDTFSSRTGSDVDSPRPSTTTTPGTSVSSLGECPLPASSAANQFPFFLLSLSSTSTLQFIAMPLSLRTAVLDTLNKAWTRGISKVQEVTYAPELMKKHTDRGCDSGVWQVTLKGECWVPRSEERVA